jgi:DNA-directed RNA polymerase specialized sigma24 family protein
MRPELETRLRRLEGCLGQLPGEHRTLVEGYYYRREEIESLASQAGRTAASTYKALQRIRQSLQTCIESAAEPEGNVF